VRVLRAPLVHFLAIGAALLALRGWRDPASLAALRPTIEIGPGALGRLREAWREEHGKSPGPAAEKTLIRDAIDEEILHREALARGYDRLDASVRERLARLASFVGEDDGGGRDALAEEAQRLGLERSDVVVRRHLVEMMRLTAARVAPEDLPSTDALAAWYARHADDFAESARIHLVHVYFALDARGAAAGTQAAALLAELRRTGAGPEAAAGRGDPFIRGTEVEGSPVDVARVFGAGFARALDAAPVGSWAGPLRSPYGIHLVFVGAREARRVPDLDVVRGRVLHAWLRERSAARARETMVALRARYDVHVVPR
jgi:hypothetical protein